MFRLALRYLPQILLILLLTALGTAAAEHMKRLGYEDRWGLDFKRELKQDIAQARLADKQLWETRLENFAMLVSSVVRFNAYARYEALAADLTAGLAGRVSDAERRLQGCAVPGGASGGSAAGAGTGGAEGLGRLRALQQRVYDTAGQCGAALETLSIKPLCECPTSPTAPSSAPAS